MCSNKEGDLQEVAIEIGVVVVGGYGGEGTRDVTAECGDDEMCGALPLGEDESTTECDVVVREVSVVEQHSVVVRLLKVEDAHRNSDEVLQESFHLRVVVVQKGR